MSPRPYRGLRVDNGEEVKGWYVYSEQLNAHYIVEVGFQSNYTYVNSLGIIYVQGSYEVRPETVGQYTGKKDGKDNEIYAGDVLKSLSNKRTLEVFWSELKAAFSARTGCHANLLSEWAMRSFEVTGNIHQNPELLEAH